MSVVRYEYIDETVDASFDSPASVRPEDAVAWLTAAVHDAGGEVTQSFDPTQQERGADPGYVSADIRVEMPDGRRVWVRVECPTDDA